LSSRVIVICLMTGALAGLTSGLMGVGGGIIMVPLLTAVLALTQHKAHGTSLAVIVFTAIASALTYIWKVHGEGASGQATIALTTYVLLAVELAAGSIAGARIGALAMNRIPARELRMVFGVFMLIVGLRLLLVPLPAYQILDPAMIHQIAGAIGVVVIGLITGIVSGMLGVGGGIVMVPAMVLILHMPQSYSQGVSLLVIVPTSIVGAYTHLKKDNVVTGLVPWIAVASIVTGVIGSMLALGPLKGVLTQVFAVFLLLVSIQLTFTAWRQAPTKKGAPASQEGS
jgi:uncharacterized membrane protein YfcA